MLRELAVENFALIESLRLELDGGFSVLTGETGAGKSIIIDALGAVLGEHLTGEAIRSGAERARVEAVFDCGEEGEPAEILRAAGLEVEEGLLVLSRQIGAERSTYHVNGRTATRSLVRELGARLVDIHGQHEHQTLIHENTHLDFLEAFAGESLRPAREVYAAAFGRFQGLEEELQRLERAERDRAERMDLLTFQVQEIEAAALTPEEEETLPAEHSRLAHAEKLQQAAREVLEALEGERGEAPGAERAVAAAVGELQAVARFDGQLLPLVEELQTAETLLRETARTLQAYAEGLEYDPRRLAQVEERLALLERLKRKYGQTAAEIVAWGERAVQELGELRELESRRAEVARELEEARAAAGAAAVELSAQRRKQALALEGAVGAEIRQLGMEQGTFAVEFARREDPEGLHGEDGTRYAATARGIDRVRFLLSANAGEPARPLAAVASGGELSRLMLALKSLSAGESVPTLVFDEIDVGIGGVVAHAVGRKLARVAAGAQVLCVTHLPQIASLADHQLQVSKGLVGERTVITARALPEEERVAELARMMGAREDQQTALKHAREMLQEARQAREAERGQGRGVG